MASRDAGGPDELLSRPPRDGSRPRVAVVGGGAMGSFFADRLSAVADVLLVARGPTLSYLRLEPAEVEGPDGAVSRRRLAVTDPDWSASPRDWRSGDRCDLLILLTQAYNSSSAARQVADHLRPDACLTLQNGLGNVEALGAAFGPERVLGGTTTVGVTWLGPGRVRVAGRGETAVGASPDTRGEWGPARVAALLTAAGIPAGTTPDLAAALWLKVCVNVGINPLTAVHRMPNGALLDGGPLERDLEAAAREAAAVARAEGARVTEAEAVARAKAVARATAANRSSMLQSVERGAPTEIEALCGEVVRRGRLHDVPTPVNARLAALVRALPVALRA